ncbi:ABC transporter permease [Ruegeria sp. 2012CJ41-6]|uniref:ABC transporter permease n=1 Tax=Ruegeria spongiae TaxID=2942209 RepID=A0ABT0Q5C6_9RHOB|nr:ABC transporter permease [Ruegeria spongiae]MCL6285076.1 ABC transporter permease [Ruegeria spongiae]
MPNSSPALLFGRFGTNGFPRYASLKTYTAIWALGILTPLLCILAVSFVKTRGINILFEPTLNAYRDLFLYSGAPVITRTLRICATVTVIEFLLAFPFALWLAKSLKNNFWKSLTFVAMMVPFFLSPAARIFVWRSVLSTEGLINGLLIEQGLIAEPLNWLLFSEFSVHFGLVVSYFPSMVWPLFLSISLIDDDYIEASGDLGASDFQTLRNVILPLAMPGILAGFIFTFVPMLGDTVVPSMLGGNNSLMLSPAIANLISSLNYTVAAAMAMLVLVAMFLMQGVFVLSLRPLGGIRRVFDGLKR